MITDRHENRLFTAKISGWSAGNRADDDSRDLLYGEGFS